MSADLPRRLGIYVHTHWSFAHPYAARTWTRDDWAGFLRGLVSLGFDTLLVWPLLDSMPDPPTESDTAALELLALVIDDAHELGLTVWLVVAPNAIGNARAAQYTYESRPYFACEQLVDPDDAAALDHFVAARRRQLQPLRAADGLAVIDSDPGGWPGASRGAFVELLARQAEAFRDLHPAATIIYWMHLGWEAYSEFRRQATALRGTPQAPTRPTFASASEYQDAIERIERRIDPPWLVTVRTDEHIRAARDTNRLRDSVFYPYALVEQEPSFPLTGWRPAEIEAGLVAMGTEIEGGAMANAQTHCLQLPHLFAFARIVREGRPPSIADLAAFAGELIDGHGARIANAWIALESAEPGEQLRLADDLRRVRRSDPRCGALAGLYFGDPDRFLRDLEDNLRVRAAMGNIAAAADSSSLKRAFREGLPDISGYQERLGYVDGYYGLFDDVLDRPLRQLGDPAVDAALADLHDWGQPERQHGSLPRLLEAVRAAIES